MKQFSAIVLAATAIVLGLVALGQMRSAAAHPASPRALRVSADDHSIARKFPGEAAIALDRLPEPSFDRLSFDLVTTEHGAVRYKRARAWSLIDEWNEWDVTLDGVPCRRRTADGGWSCDGTSSIVKPDVVEVRGELWAAAVVSGIENGRRLHLRATFAPSTISATLVALAAGGLPSSVTAERDGHRVDSECRNEHDSCRVALPNGSGALRLGISGPSLAFGIDLRAE